MAKVLSIVAPEMFQEIEYHESRKALEGKGHEVIMGSSVKTPTDKLGVTYEANVLLDEVRVEDYDAIVFIGGPGSATYFDDAVCHRLAREFYKTGKPTTAICAAPVILGRAALLKGMKATCWPAQAEELVACGAKYTKAHVEKDGLIITGDGPGSAYEFGLAVADALN